MDAEGHPIRTRFRQDFWRHDEKMARSKTDIAAELTLSSGRTFDVRITGFFERDEVCAAE